MDKVYNHKEAEDKHYKTWEEKGYFKPEINPDGKPYCIILPPPNANGDLHFGHAMFTVEDILIRYHRMKGDAALWLPGTDHAGIETQFVFEKKLQSEGQSRFDYSQEELYQMIWDFVKQSHGKIQNQLKKLGYSLDWSREKFTLDPEIQKLVYKTFKKMYEDGLIYRAHKLVNYCTRDGTSFSDLEVIHEERNSPLYYIRYGPLVLATTRPETKFGDTGVAVNPNDERYKQYIGKEIEIETVLGKASMKVVGDEAVDPEFGTGVVKVTPAHDFTDFEIGKRHDLPLKQVIGYDGKMNDHAGRFEGLYVKQARAAIVEEMKEKNLIEKVDEGYMNRVGLCYKCKTILEPLPLEQWFVKVDSLRNEAIRVIKEKKVKIHPQVFETHCLQWLENLRDWNISRQIVWGMRIPAWKNKATGEWMVTEGDSPEGMEWEQDTDTFDTWFSSGQWPFVTLKTSKDGDFEKFYPTAVLETAYDILRAWVSRMVMLGTYVTGEVPFRNVLFHGIVNDPYGKKMSKSKGNVVNPLELIEQYGADAVRFALVYGNATGNDQSLSYPKLDAARKFTNKLWNMARFIEMAEKDANQEFGVNNSLRDLKEGTKLKENYEWIEKAQNLIDEVTKYIDSYQFNLAAERLYEFSWHEFADIYIEDIKRSTENESWVVLKSIYVILLKLLHPFMPFVTEEIYQKMSGHGESIMIEKWPSI
ncbi:MAG: valine--tRNA ligase [Candidatus Levybacteria bacterium]|nr:valine--tRNA ligase [Candidatus Levybacteria bacterium]